MTDNNPSPAPDLSSLGNLKNLDEIIAAIRGGHDADFWCGLDAADLQSRLDKPRKAQFESIQPVWDLRPASIERNELVPEALRDLVLYLSDRETFLTINRWIDIYSFPSYRRRSSSSKIQRVVGHWERGDGLTPPVFALLPTTRKLIKQDGHHRTAVAVMSRAPLIPFYSKDTISRPGIFRCPDHLRSLDAWTAPPTEDDLKP